MFYWQEDPSKIQQGRKSGTWLKVEIIAVKGPTGSYQNRCEHCSGRCEQVKKTFGALDLEELPDLRQRTGAPVLWFSCEGQKDVWELFSDNSYLSAILDRQGLMLAAPVDLRTKRSEGFSPQPLQLFLSNIKTNNPKIVVMSPTVFTHHTNHKKKSFMATVPSVLGHYTISKSRW